MELKPCPFCGSKAIEADNEIVYCSGLECIVSFIKKEQWQSRPLEDALQRKLEIAKEALNRIATGEIVSPFDMSDIAEDAILELGE